MQKLHLLHQLCIGIVIGEHDVGDVLPIIYKEDERKHAKNIATGGNRTIHLLAFVAGVLTV